jgi:plastocyanin
MKTLAFTFLFVLAPSAWGLEQTYYKERTLDVPYREQAVIIGKEGFYPNRITVFKGEKVRFFVTSVGVDSACFNIPDKNVFTSPKGEKIIETEAFFDKVGVFQFNCPNNTFTGRVMVLEKASDRAETNRRGLASDLVKVWIPKDTPSEWVQVKREDIKEDYIDLDHDRVDRDETPKDQPRESFGFGGRDLATED